MNNQVCKDDILFITAEVGYVKTGLEKGGYDVLHPYNYRTIIGRLMLEVFSRLKLSQVILFNKKILKKEYKYIIVYDSIITKSFLLWLQSKCPNSKIIYQYTNMVGKAHHILPKEIPQGIDVWTYDKYDSENYGIKLSKIGGYLTYFIGTKKEKKYDIMYVGKDKGRANYILGLQKRFEDLGLTTKFMIMPTTRFSRNKKIYSKPISYEEVIELVTESRAILNITLPNQQGITLRDYESIYNEVKLITTNKNIVNYDFYKKENIFILDQDDDFYLKEFIEKPFISLDQSILNKYCLDEAISEMLE